MVNPRDIAGERRKKERKTSLSVDIRVSVKYYTPESDIRELNCIV